MTTDSISTLVPRDEARRIRAAFDVMPHGAMIARLPVEELTVDDIRVALLNLREVLLKASETAQNNERKLRALEDQRDAVRAFFGTEPSA